MIKKKYFKSMFFILRLQLNDPSHETYQNDSLRKKSEFNQPNKANFVFWIVLSFTKNEKSVSN